MLAPLAGRRDLKAIVFRSAIPGTFSAGVDVRDHTRERVAAMLEAFHGVFRRLHALPQATVAAVDGTCLGGGCELAAFCDVVLATPRSVFGQPEIDVGCFPPLAAVMLPRVAPRAAAELILTGAPIAASEAARVGLDLARRRRPRGRDEARRPPPRRQERGRPGPGPTRRARRRAAAPSRTRSRESSASTSTRSCRPRTSKKA